MSKQKTKVEKTKKLYTVTHKLRGEKTWDDIFLEAKEIHPDDEELQCQYAAELMKKIGFDVSTQISGS